MYSTNYKVAAHWLNNNLILCNDIPNIDESIIENMRFSCDPEDTDDDEDSEAEDWHETDPFGLWHPESYREIFQWFLTDCSESDVEFLEEHFGILFTFSPVLDLYVLCVDHYGTSWDYVHCYTDLENAAREEGQDK